MINKLLAIVLITTALPSCTCVGGYKLVGCNEHTHKSRGEGVVIRDSEDYKYHEVKSKDGSNKMVTYHRINEDYDM
jgi:hypothetical protein